MPAAIAAVVILAGIATLANLSAASAIRESRALVEAALERAHRETLRARAMHLIPRRSRSQLMAAAVPLGGTDTTLTTTALSWPWHVLRIATGGATKIEELARATMPAVPWCAAIVYANIADVAGSVVIPPLSGCSERVHASPENVVAFDSALTGATAISSIRDTVLIDSDDLDIVRARQAIVVAATASVGGLLIAPVVRIHSGANVRGMIVALDSAVVSAGATVVADENSVLEALRNRARLAPVGRRGTILR